MISLRKILNISFLLFVFLLSVRCSFREEKFKKPKTEAETPINAYTAFYNRVIKAHCLTCHSAEFPRGGINLSSYQSIMETSGVIAGNAEESLLYQEVKSGNMPAERAKLSEEEILLVWKWIQTGAKQ